MKYLIAAVAAAVITAAAAPLVAPFTTARTVASSTPAAAPLNGDVAVGVYAKRLHGVTAVVEVDTGLRVRGVYSGLKKKTTYFNLLYGNGRCETDGAFSLGSFTTGKRGKATIDQAPVDTTDLNGLRSMAIRRADTEADLDHDGQKGPTDPVGVPGKPKVGLVECDLAPLVFFES